MDQTEALIIETIDRHREEILEFARDIYSHAELGYKEFQTSGKFVKKMEQLGLRTEKGFAITGVKAYLNEDKKANPETNAAHCCGHHAQMAGVFGAALALTVPEIAEKLDGQVVFFATPAEEYGEIEFKNQLREQGKIRYGGGKCELLRIVTPISLLIFFNSFRIDSVVCGSSALVASSQSRMSGVVVNALAIPTLCFCPPDNWLT